MSATDILAVDVDVAPKFYFVSPAAINQGSVVKAFLAAMALVFSAKWDDANP
jgi:hypothetical protein